MNRLSPAERWFAAVMIPIIGLGLLAFSIRNMVLDFQLLNSPLDEAGTAAPAASAGGNRAGEVEFLPLVAPADQEAGGTAPEIDRALPEQEIQFLDYRVRLAVRGELSAADAFIKPLLVPDRLIVEALGIDHPVVPVSSREIEFQGEAYQQWTAPRSGHLGWHYNSALVGAAGNTVINGHSSGYGETFRDLESLENGDLIQIQAGDVMFSYVVANVMVLKERWEPIEVRMENARWISSSRDERLTLVSCWPYNSNTHRVVVVALPAGYEKLPDARVSQPLEQAQLP